MLTIVSRLSPSTVSAIREHLDSLAEHLTPDVSRYARGRQRFWLEHEAPLGRTRNWQPGVHSDRLWSWVQRSFPGVELGLAAYGEVGIDPHRDASYADYTAYSVNLGTIEGWYYDPMYPDMTYSDQRNASNPVIYRLEPGDVVRFNCKNPHGVINPAPDRWSLNLWHISPKGRPGFDAYMASK